MSSVRQKVAAVNKAVWKAEEEKLHGNKQVINEDANNETEKVEKKVVKKKAVKKTVTKAKAKVKKNS